MEPTKEEKQRTLLQNRALHKYFALLAEELNVAGLDMKRTLKPEIDIAWTTESVKEYLWRPVQKAQLNKESTTKITTKDIDIIFDTINKHLGEKFGLHIYFPSIESQMDELRTYP